MINSMYNLYTSYLPKHLRVSSLSIEEKYVLGFIKGDMSSLGYICDNLLYNPYEICKEMTKDLGFVKYTADDVKSYFKELEKRHLIITREKGEFILVIDIDDTVPNYPKIDCTTTAASVSKKMKEQRLKNERKKEILKILEEIKNKIEKLSSIIEK